MEITMARGDLEIRTFQIRVPDGQGGTEPFTEALDEIYMTVKKSFNDRNYLFQKRLTSGGIILLGEGRYQFTVEPADTNGLGFGDYDFDIEIVKNGSIKKTFSGTLKLLRETTHASNEVSA